MKHNFGEHDAVEFAKNIAVQEGWTWLPPIVAKRNETSSSVGAQWEVVSNANSIGAKVKIRFVENTGEVLEKKFFPR